MIIAVTGASGSIGKELVPFLKDIGHQVLLISSSISIFEDSIFSYSDLQNKKIPFKVDIFLHLASINSNLKEKGQINPQQSILRMEALSL